MTQQTLTPPAPRPTRAEQLRASPPLFEAPWLDRLTRVHPAVPVVIFAPAIAVLMILGVRSAGALTAGGLMVGGYALWTLTEYWLHRVVFHFEPEEGIGARLHFLIHGVHHDHPNDPKRLVMPPSASIPLAALFLGAFYVVLGPDLWAALGAGFVAGYLAYDMTHFWLHHRVPRGRVGRFLREAHMRHHFQDHDTGFGVSAPYWDRVFGTAPARRATRARD